MLAAYETPVGQGEYIAVGNNAVGKAAQALTERVRADFEMLFGSIYRSAIARRDQNRVRIQALVGLRQNWDSYGAPPPNERAASNAIRVLNLLESIRLDPTRILASAEGGIGICFIRGDRYADIECSNEGEVLGVYYIGPQMPALLETDASDASILAALERIRDHIRD
jgi:hypothetical protein